MAKLTLPGKRKVGHLTLLREPRDISLGDFNRLPQDEQLALLRSCDGRQKYQLLIEAANGPELVASLPAQEFYLLTRELGLVDIPELISLGTPEQLTTLLDLDAWDDDRFDGRAGLLWLTALLDAGEEKVLATVSAMESELLTLLLQQWMRVTGGPEDFDDDDARAEAVGRNGGYVIDYSDSEGGKQVGALLDILWRLDRDHYLQLVEGVRQEFAAELEEDVYRWRNGRLLDLGFPDPLSAVAVFSWLDPERFDPAAWAKPAGEIPAAAAEPPGFVLTASRPQHLLAEVLAAGVDDATLWELTYLLNKVMAAERVDPGDHGQLRHALERLYGLLNLALELLSGGDAACGAELFGAVYLEALFRYGFSLTLRLQRRAEQLRRSCIDPYLDGPFRELIDALRRPRPEYPHCLDGGERSGSRLFATAAELRTATLWLDRLEIPRALFENHFPDILPAPEAFDLDGCVPAEAAELEISDLFLTALANRLLGRAFAPLPLAAGDLAGLHRLICRDGRLDPELGRRTRDWLESLEPGGAGFADWCLAVWDEEFCPLPEGEIDPRYVAGLIVRVDG